MGTTGETVRSLPLVAVSTPRVFPYVRGGSYSRRNCGYLLFYGALVIKHDGINIYRMCDLCWQLI